LIEVYPLLFARTEEMMHHTLPLSSEEQTQTVVNFIANVPLFDPMERDELEVVARYMKLSPFSEGEILFNEWDKGDYACFVVDGKLDVLTRRDRDTDRYKTTASLERGKSIGELSIIENFPRLATLKACTCGSVVTFSREDFTELLEKHTQIGIKILKGLIGLLSHNLRKTSSRLSDYMMPMT
jgi:CRP/FNR family transcriptional regulator, cyclic AMP receptor protein